MASLRLRQFEQQDEYLLCNYLNDQDVTAFLSSRIPSPYSTEDAKQWIQEGSRCGFIRAIDIGSQFAGCVGIEPGHFEYALSGELGYWLARPFWGNGYATEAVKQMCAYIANHSELVRLHATVFDGNLASERVLLKSGFCLKGQYTKAAFKNSRLYDTKVFEKLIRNI